MAVDTYALTSLTNAKQYLGIDNDDARQSGFAIYHDESSSATEATVQIAEDTLTLTITGGANAGTQTFALDSASYDTLTELVDAINGLDIGWIARLLGPTDTESVKLIPFPTESVFGQANEHVLDYQDDALLEAIINRVSDLIETLADRKFKSRSYREWCATNNGEPIVLDQYPVTAVKRLSTGSKSAMTVKATTSTDLRATVEIQDDQIILSRYDSAGSETSTALTFATYPTVTLLAAQINLTTGWSATVNSNTLTLDLNRMGGQDALSRDVTVTYPDTSCRDYRVDEGRGLIYFVSQPDGFGPRWDIETIGTVARPLEHMNVLVEYTAGYTTIPDDLEHLALEFVKMAYHARRHDSSLASESLGDYSKSLISGLQLTDSQRAKVMAWRDLR